MPAGCRFRPRCAHAATGCDAEQALQDAGGGRKVRCWRFRELDLPGAVDLDKSRPLAMAVPQ
jgi:peptide/nickel transport system ATP-binding protein